MHFVGVIFCLGYALGEGFIPGLSLNNGEIVIAIGQDVIRAQPFRAMAVSSFKAAQRDFVFATNAAALDHAPPCRFQRGINVLGSGFRFVHRISRYCP